MVIDRRTFLKHAGTVAAMGLVFPKNLLAIADFKNNSVKEIIPGVFLFTDSCNVFCIRSGKEAILIESGKGEIQNHLKEIGVEKVDWILHTHHHRDLSAGDSLFTKKGTKIAVPEGSKQHYESAEKNWYERQTYYPFNYGPKYFLPLRNIPVSKTLKGGDVFKWKDIILRVLDTPGHTENHISFILERDGKKFAFTGDVIAAPGQVWEMDALQSHYEEFIQGEPVIKRVPELLNSIKTLRAEKPALILPAHGKPFGNCDAGLAKLKANIEEMQRILCDVNYFADSPQITVPEIQLMQTCASQYLIEKDGHAVLYDAGFIDFTYPDGTKYDFIDEMRKKEASSLKKIDIISLSHYHCDHNAMANGVAKHFNSKIYVHECLKDFSEEPHRFFLPCLHRHPIKIDRTFKDGESFEWHGYKFTFYHFPGQTWWHQAMLAEINGKRILFVGDSIDSCDHIRCIDTFNYNPISDTDGGMKCVDVIEKTKPDFVATGHGGIRKWKPEYNKKLRDFMKKRNAVLTKLIAREDPNFGYDVHWARLDPFRSVVTKNRKLKLTARIRNNLPKEGNVALSLSLPEGWTSFPKVARGKIDAKSEGAFDFTIKVPKKIPETRYMVGLNATLNNKKHGELGMAVVDVGKDHDVLIRKPELVPGVSFSDYGYYK